MENNKTKLLFTLLFFLFLQQLHAQLNDISLNINLNIRKDFFNPDEFLKLSNSTAFNSSNSLDFENVTSNLGWNILLGFNLFKKENKIKKLNPIFKAGLSSLRVDLSNDFSNFQTFSSSSSYLADYGDNLKVDSILKTNSTLNLNYRQIFFQNGIEFTLLKEKRLSFNFGALLQLGIVKQNANYEYLTIDSMTIKSFQINGQNYEDENSFSFNSVGRIDKKLGNSSFAMGISMPLAMQFRIGKKNKVLKNLFLRFEYAPFLQTIYYTELNSFKKSFVNSYSLFSLKYQLNHTKNESK